MGHPWAAQSHYGYRLERFHAPAPEPMGDSDTGNPFAHGYAMPHYITGGVEGLGFDFIADAAALAKKGLDAATTAIINKAKEAAANAQKEATRAASLLAEMGKLAIQKPGLASANDLGRVTAFTGAAKAAAASAKISADKAAQQTSVASAGPFATATAASWAAAKKAAGEAETVVAKWRTAPAPTDPKPAPNATQFSWVISPQQYQAATKQYYESQKPMSPAVLVGLGAVAFFLLRGF